MWKRIIAKPDFDTRYVQAVGKKKHIAITDGRKTCVTAEGKAGNAPRIKNKTAQIAYSGKTPPRLFV